MTPPHRWLRAAAAASLLCACGSDTPDAAESSSSGPGAEASPTTSASADDGAPAPTTDSGGTGSSTGHADDSSSDDGSSSTTAPPVMIDPEGDGDYEEPPPYVPGPDSMRHDGIPQGTVTQATFDTSSVFDGSTRQYWVYIPAQYDGSGPVASMVFQDGGNYVNEAGLFRTTIVLDNLIAAGDLPVMVAVFVDPGTIDGNSNRSFEYDNLSADYAQFIIDELLPQVAADHGIDFSDAPEDRGIAGHSSGGICAFTVGWHRPDLYGRIMTHNGSFTNIMGGGAYPQMIRDGEVLPLRVSLLSGTNDLDNQFGSWLQANIDMAAALAERGYHYRFVRGEGSHTPDHAGAVMPDTLRWLWREPLVEG